MKFQDERGWLKIKFESDDIVFKESFSKRNVLRGLHYQSFPNEQVKMINVKSGSILDFQYDVQSQNSDITCMKIDSTMGWLLVPKKFAHGFYALEDTIFQYVCIGKYSLDFEKSYNISDALYRDKRIDRINISTKDANGIVLKNKIISSDSQLVKI